MIGYRSAIDTHLRPAFGTWALEDIATGDVEAWRDGLRSAGTLSSRTVQKPLIVFHGVMERARKHFGLPANPVSDVERPRPAARLEIDVLSPEEVLRLVDAATDEQDAALFLTAASAGLGQCRSRGALTIVPQGIRLGDLGFGSLRSSAPSLSIRVSQRHR